MEVKLKRFRNIDANANPYWRPPYYYDSLSRATVCPSVLNRQVNLPKGTDTIYAVYTKRKNKCSFRLVNEDINNVEYSAGGYRPSLTVSADKYNREAYKRGYRYVHFEY